MLELVSDNARRARAWLYAGVLGGLLSLARTASAQAEPSLPDAGAEEQDLAADSGTNPSDPDAGVDPDAAEPAGDAQADEDAPAQEPGEASSEPQASPVPAPPVAPPPAPVEVVVHRQLTAREQLQRSSDAVAVVDLRQARRRSADLGEVLARTSGVSIRRFGGLGSEFRFSLNGLTDAQIRVFVDGVPIDRVYAVGLANVPVNLIQDVEIYRGVVPLRLGADALGGAVNLVTAARYETTAQASYQVGSFGTQRATLAGRYRHDRTGVIAGIDAFLDDAENNYWVDNVTVPEADGTPTRARVRRFHDAYRAYGLAGEVGVVDQPWARKLLARGFYSSYAKQIQNNIVMTVPYGEPHNSEDVLGGVLTYQNDWAKRYDLDVVASYTHRTIDFVDKGNWVYNWRGERIRKRPVPGEIEARAYDQTIWQHGVFGRATFDARLAPGHKLTLTTSPNYATRTGDEDAEVQVRPDQRDPLTAERKLFKLVSGLAYTASFVPLAGAPREREARRPEHYRVENVLFAKNYAYRVDSEDPQPGGVFRRSDTSLERYGVGDSVRVTLLDDYLLAKLSYEYATRLPETDEVFGNGVLVHPNLELRPETSHNANLGPQLDLRKTKAGAFWLDVNGFFRDSDELIVLLGTDRNYTYQNVRRARSMGIESAGKWTSPGRYLTLDAQVTYMDLRNTSAQGLFGKYEGDRIPNRPWLFSSWGGFLRFEGVLWKRDRVEPFYQGRYVHEFYRTWESEGLLQFKPTVEAQVSHGVGVTYALELPRGTLHGTFEVQNLTDAELFDTFGVQRPGRGYYFKLVGEL